MSACICLVSLLSACGTPSDGYYDANGNYIPYNRYNQEAHPHGPLPGGTHDSRDNDRQSYTTVTTTTTYDRAGYYDHNGNYTAMDRDLRVSDNMFPSHGMCRVWFPDRSDSNQPRIESCDGIQSRVPTGAYVIYGG